MRFYEPLSGSSVSYLLTPSHPSFPVTADNRTFRVWWWVFGLSSAVFKLSPGIWSRRWGTSRSPQLYFRNVLKLINQEINLSSRLSDLGPSLAYQHLFAFNLHCFRREKNQKASLRHSVFRPPSSLHGPNVFVNGCHIYIWASSGSCEERRVMNPPVKKPHCRQTGWQRRKQGTSSFVLLD